MPEQFVERGWSDDIRDQNIVFALESERRDHVRIHDRQAARDLWGSLSGTGDKSSAICLITGNHAPIARLHPSIKGVWGAQTAGASIVSFNLDAFTSYGHLQGDNAPVSEAATFAYTSALNHFLERDSGHRIQVGDTSTVFWAEAPQAESAIEAEDFFASFFAPDDKAETRKIEPILAKLRSGRPIDDFDPALTDNVRFSSSALPPMLLGSRSGSTLKIISGLLPNATSSISKGFASSRRQRRKRLPCGGC